EACPRHRQHAVMHMVPRLGAAVDRGVLAHRRDDDAIGQRDAAQVDGREQNTHGGSSSRKSAYPLIDGPVSWPSHSSISRRAIESRRGMKNEPSLGRFSGRSSSRLNQSAEASSSWLTSKSRDSASAWKPIITEAGNGQGCEER